MKIITFILGLVVLQATVCLNCNAQNQQAMRHEFVMQGKNAKEMAVGNYVVFAVFNAESNAKHFKDGLHKSGYTDSNYGYLSNKKSWFVYIKSADADKIEDAQQIRDKYRKTDQFKDAWLLTVHK